MLRICKLFGVVVAGFLLAGPVAAEGTMNHADHAMTHQADGNSSVQVAPVEPGQGAFAALAEIAFILRSDPQTDWTKVNLLALQNHLVDMSDLILRTDVTISPTEHGVIMTVDLSKDTNAAAGRIVPAHAPVLANETGWLSHADTDGSFLVWKVTDERDAAQIKALGFFGLMATGDHHRAHHLGLAKGASHH